MPQKRPKHCDSCPLWHKAVDAWDKLDQYLFNLKSLGMLEQ